MRLPTSVLLTTLVLAATLAAGCTSGSENRTTSSAPAGETHLHVDYGTARAAVDAHVPFGIQASKPHYDAAGRTHPGGYTAFDQLAQWAESSGTDLDVELFGFGFCVNRIGGLPAKPSCHSGSDAYWSLEVNGAASEVGMEQVQLRAGDEVRWTLTSISS